MLCRKINDTKIIFWCEPCNTHHWIDTTRWSWNGSFDKPTFRPSILVHQTETLSKLPPENCEDLEKWCNEYRIKTPLCHSYVTDGKIEYLSDCTHEFKGQTKELCML